MTSQRQKKINVNVLIPFLVIALVFGGMIWKKYQESRKIPTASHIQPEVGKRTAVLFFVADGVRLARESRELDSCDGADDCVNSVLEELLNGPIGEFEEPLPEGTTINSVRVDNDLAIVDVNTTFAKALPSGSSSEMLAVYSIVNTVTANFPKITRVKLTLEGAEAAQLRHLDLSDPLQPNYALEEPPRSDVNTPSSSTPSKPHKGKP